MCMRSVVVCMYVNMDTFFIYFFPLFSVFFYDVCTECGFIDPFLVFLFLFFVCIMCMRRVLVCMCVCTWICGREGEGAAGE